MSIVTISRLESSGGYEIGKNVADRLGYSLVTKDTIEEIFDQYGMIDFNKQYEAEAAVWDSLHNFQQTRIDFLKRVHVAFAHHDNVVIVGRGSFATLYVFSDVLNVRLWAPLNWRVSRYMAQHKLDDHDEAEKHVIESDKRRETFVNTWFHSQLEKSVLFDVTLNTAKVSIENCVELIVHSVIQMNEVGVGGGRKVKTEIVDSVLEEAIDQVLHT